MIAGTLEIQLLANMARLQKDMDDAKRTVGGAMSKIESSVATAKGALIGLGAVGLAASFANSLKGAIDLADSMNKLSQRTGIAAEDLSQLQYAARLADVSSDSLTSGMKKLNVSIAGGIAGDKEKVATFKALGITLTDVQGRTKSADQVLLAIADTFAKSKDGAGKTAAAVGLLGKAGDEMIPLLNGGSGAIKDLMKEADKLGLTISTDFARKAEEFNDNLTRLGTSSQKLSIALGGELVSGLGDVVKLMADAAISGGKLHAIWVGLDEVGNRLFDWSGNAQRKNIKNIEGDITALREQQKLLTMDIFGQGGAIDADLTIKLALLAKAKTEYFKLSDGAAGGGRGVAADPRRLGRVGSIEEQVKGLKEIKIPGPAPSGVAESEYIKLIKRIQEQLDLDNKSLALGRELTESEKFRVKVTSDMAASKVVLTAAERASVEVKLKEKEMLDLSKDVQKSELEQAKQVSAERQRLRNADYESVRKVFEGELDLQNARNKTMRDVLLGLADETAGLTLTNAEREVAIRLREIERQGLEKGSIAYEEYAAKIKEAVGKKSAIDDGVRAQVDMWQSIDGAARDAFVNIGKNGTNVFDKLKDSLQSGLYALLYEMTVKKWLINISTQISGAGVSQQALGTGSSLSGLAGLGSSLNDILKYAGSSNNPSAANYTNSFDNMNAGGGGGSFNWGSLVSLFGGFFADGGSPPLNKISMVGERGPELFVPQSAGTIVPNQDLGAMGGTTFAPSYHITVAGGIGAGEAVTAIQRALEANNRQMVKDLQRQGVLA